MFTILSVYMKNQNTWIFRWLFIIVVPQLLGKHNLKRFQVIISDGDAQEYHQIDYLIIKYFTSAK